MAVTVCSFAPGHTSVMAIATPTVHGLAFAAVLFIVAPASAQGTAPVPDPARSAETPMPSFASLFSKLPADLRRLPTLTNGVWLGGTGALAFAVHAKDRTITQQASGSLGLETLLDTGASMGGGFIQVGGALGTYLVGRLANRPDIAGVGADLVRAQIINVGLTQGVKVAVNRERPDGSRYSFPSGHSASSFATATVLERQFGWKVGIPAYAMATYVAGSRLSENKHYLSDVVFGAGIGIVSGRAVTVGRGSQTFALSPTVVPGGFGLNFTRIAAQ
jgi:membrane-associated phospholipid phosphatase